MNERLLVPEGLRSVIHVFRLRGPLSADSTARILHALVLVLTIWSAIWTIGTLPLYPNLTARLLRLRFILVADLVPVTTLILLRLGHLRQAAYFYLTGQWVQATYNIAINGSIEITSTAFYITLPVLAAWLLGFREAFWAGGICLGSALILALRQGPIGVLLPTAPLRPPLLIWANLVQLTFTAAAPVAHILQTLKETLARSRSDQEELRRSEARWNAAIENLGAGVVIATDTEQVIYRNPAALVMHGFTSGQTGIGPLQEMTRIFQLWTADGRLLPLDEWPLRRIKRGETLNRLELRLHRLDQEWEKIISYSGAMVESAIGERLMFVSAQDLTDQRKAEHSLRESEERWRESEERFRGMADTAPVLIWVAGPDKLCTFFNKVWLDFTGRTMEQELGNGWAEGVHPDDLDRCVGLYVASFDARRRFRMEYRLRRADGEYRWILDEGVPRFTRNGNFLGYIGSCIDITDLRRTHEQTLVSQKLESVGQLASGVAHDFNNLLSGILACAEIAAAEVAEGSLPAAEHLQRIQTAAVRGAEIVRQLMTYAGEIQPALERIDLSSLVKEMLQLLEASISKQVILDAELSTGLPSILGSPAQIRQVVMNLVINAAEAIGERAGRVHVKASRVHVSMEAAVTSQAHLLPGLYIKLEVSDTGSGMTPEVQARIFDPFFTTKSTGHGLGLAVVQGIVRSHFGSLNIVSAIGQGSRFEVLLPSADQSTALSRTSTA